MTSSLSKDRSTQVRIRAACPADQAELLRLIRAYYRYDGIRFKPELAAKALKKLLRDPSLGRIWMARAGARSIGYVAFSFHYDVEFGGLEGVITDLFVRGAYRGRGLGTALLATVEDYCRSAAIRSIELQVIRRNRAAEKFYQKHGFRKLARIIMARELR